MRILVCGDRNWTDGAWIHAVLAQHDKDTVVIEGDARGADRLAGIAADRLFTSAKEVYPALWNLYGKRAGFMRNTEMLVQGKPDLVYAFHLDLAHSKGTAMMVRIAAEAGVKVIVNPERPAPEPPKGLDIDLRRELNQQYEDLIVEIQERNDIIRNQESTIRTLTQEQVTLKGGLQVRRESADHHAMLRLAIESLLAVTGNNADYSIDGIDKARQFALNILDLTKGDAF